MHVCLLLLVDVRRVHVLLTLCSARQDVVKKIYYDKNVVSRNSLNGEEVDVIEVASAKSTDLFQL